MLQQAGRAQVEEIREIFGQAHELGRPILRTNAFMDGGDNPGRIRDADGSVRDEGLAALDLLLDEARQAGVRLLLVLTNNWADYGGAPAVLDAVAPGEDLPKDAFWSDTRAVAAQSNYIDVLVSRHNTLNGADYRSDPTIFAWELANEARCDHPDFCEEDTLVQWAEVMGDAVREAGAVQPVAWGGAGYLKQHGERLRQFAESGAVDVPPRGPRPEDSPFRRHCWEAGLGKSGLILLIRHPEVDA